MIKLIDTHYKAASAETIEEWLIDTDAEVKDLPKAPAGSYAISAETGAKFFVKTSGEWE